MPKVGDNIAFKKTLGYPGRIFAKGDIGIVRVLCNWCGAGKRGKPDIYFNAVRDPDKIMYHVKASDYEVLL